jgi:hypothetical protein
MTRIARSVVCASVLSLLISVPAAADPVSINNGFLVATGPTALAPVFVTGSQGFSVMGAAAVSGGHIDPFDDCSPCAPGAMISAGGALDNAFMGQATLNGNTYPLTTGSSSPNPLSWELFGSVVAPAANMMGFALVQVPFTMTGLFSPGGSGVPLSGHGMASLFFTPAMVSEGEPFAWNASIVTYSFAEGAAATPEPASLTLIGLGLIAGGMAIRRRQAA